MVSQTQIQSVLDDSRWKAGIVDAARSSVAVQLQTFPGVVGGEFKALVVGLLPEHIGQAEISISSSGFESENFRHQHRPSNPNISFLEVESFQIQGPTLEVQFLIPFEAKGTNEGYSWHLQIQFASGTTEVFEVPVCRTFESNPEVSEIEIAAAGLNKEERWHPQISEEKTGSWKKSFDLTKANQELHLSIPSRIARRPSLATGLGVFWGIWAAVTALFYWIFEGELEPMLILGIPLIAMTVLLTFAVFGVSRVKFCQEQMEQRHSLFGLSFPKRVKRSEITGFLTKCVGSLGDAGGSYLVVAEKNDSSNVFLSAALLNKNDAHTLVKRLNKFWEIKQHY